VKVRSVAVAWCSHGSVSFPTLTSPISFGGLSRFMPRAKSQVDRTRRNGNISRQQSSKSPQPTPYSFHCWTPRLRVESAISGKIQDR
jgi:hypothetical protein